LDRNVSKLLLVFKWNLGECSQVDISNMLRLLSGSGVVRELSRNVYEVEGSVNLGELMEHAYRSVTLSDVIVVREEVEIGEGDCTADAEPGSKEWFRSVKIVIIGEKPNKVRVVNCLLGKFIQKNNLSLGEIYPEHGQRFFLLVDFAREKAYWGEIFHSFRRDRFTYRSPEKRPYLQFSALSPKLALFLVNLSTQGPGESNETRTFLDPFCGSGSTLIEAALLGFYAVGVEIHYRPIRGARRNAIFHGLYEKVDLILSDASMLPLRANAVDATAFDPPYGRLASAKGRSPDETLKLALRRVKEALKKSGSCVFLYPYKGANAELRDLGCEEICWIREHSSLTRSVWRCTK